MEGSRNVFSKLIYLIAHNRKAQIITSVVAVCLVGAIIASVIWFSRGKTIYIPGKNVQVVVPPDDEPYREDEENDGDDIFDDGFDYTEDPDSDEVALPSSTIDTFVKYAKPFDADSESVIYNVDVSKIGADRTGRKDSSLVIQAAIDAVDEIGGGTVFVPSGKYRLMNPIMIPSTVVLVGDWKSPEKGGGKGEGTVFLIYADKGKTSDKDVAQSPIFLEGGLKNVSFWYPQQNCEQIVEYPFTITSSYAVSMMNLTFYNSYEGINALSASLLKIRNVYGTFLKTGITAENAYDVPRIEKIRIDTSYWQKSGLPGAPSSEEDIEYVNKFTRYFLNGMVFGQMDWGMLYDVSIRHANNGIYHYPPFGHISIGKYNVSDVNYGLYMKDNVHILQVMDSNINASEACIYSNDTNNGSIVVSNTVFSTKSDIPKYGIQIKGKLPSPISVKDSVFEGWTINAISTEGNSLAVSNTQFKMKENLIDAPYITSERFMCSNNAPEITLSNSAVGELPTNIPDKIEETPTDYANYEFAPIKEPERKAVYNVIDYGACSDGSKDASSIIQKVLDIAGSEGGGFVVLPTGRYRMDHSITVPTGVELRSMSERPQLVGPESQSLLMVYAGKNTEKGALITLEEGAGLKNISMLYPEQGWKRENKIIPYPYTVRCNKNSWVYNVTPANSYRAFDLITNNCDNAIVAEVQGYANKNFVELGHGSKNVILQSVHMNPGVNTALVNIFEEKEMASLKEYATRSLEYMRLGEAPELKMFNCFGIFSKAQLKLIKDPYTNKSFTGSVYMVLFDVSQDSIVGESGSQAKINLIQALYVANAHADETGYPIRTKPGFKGEINLFNASIWGYSNIANVEGGTVNIIQLNSKGYNKSRCSAGELNLKNTLYGLYVPENEQVGTGKINLIGNIDYHH